jgi:hypothetical protein
LRRCHPPALRASSARSRLGVPASPRAVGTPMLSETHSVDVQAPFGSTSWIGGRSRRVAGVLRSHTLLLLSLETNVGRGFAVPPPVKSGGFQAAFFSAIGFFISRHGMERRSWPRSYSKSPRPVSTRLLTLASRRTSMYRAGNSFSRRIRGAKQPSWTQMKAARLDRAVEQPSVPARWSPNYSRRNV